MSTERTIKQMTTINKTKEQHVVYMIIIMIMTIIIYFSHDHQRLIVLPAGSQIQQTKANVVVNSQIQTAAGFLSDKFYFMF